MPPAPAGENRPPGPYNRSPAVVVHLGPAGSLTMLTYRTFRNTDPPTLVSIWRSCAGQPALVQPVSADLLEQYVFAKLYFDYHGLILACDDGEAVGFAHAGFGPNDEETAVATEMGTTCLVLTRPDYRKADVAAGLLERSEAYLCRQGAKVLYGGGHPPLERLLLRPLRRQRNAGRVGNGPHRPAGLSRPRLRGDRPHARPATGLGHLRGGRGPPPDASAAADGGRGGGRSAVADLVGGLHPRRIRVDAFRAGAARRRADRRQRRLPQHELDATPPARDRRSP